MSHITQHSINRAEPHLEVTHLVVDDAQVARGLRLRLAVILLSATTDTEMNESPHMNLTFSSILFVMLCYGEVCTSTRVLLSCADDLTTIQYEI